MNPVERDREAGRSIFEHITNATVKERWVTQGEGGKMEVKRIMQREAVLATLGEMDVEGAIDPRLSEILEWIVKRRD